MFLLLLILAVSVLGFLIRRHYNYWARRNIPHESPAIPFGSLNAVRRKERSFGLLMSDIYARSKDKLVGIFLLFKPAILVRDAAIVRQILTTDFDSFHDRGIYVDEKHDPYSGQLFALEGKSWRTLRAKLTPAFTSGKLKGMFDAIDDVADKMVQQLNDVVLKDSEQPKLVDIKTLFATYAIDIIGSVIFGLDIDSYADPENKFREISNEIFAPRGFLATMRELYFIICPTITRLLTRVGFKDNSIIQMRHIIQNTIETRERNKMTRKDFLQLLIQLRNTGKISDDNDKIWNVETAADGLKSMSFEMIAAQAHLFYIAGSDTTSSAISYTLYELAMYPELLKRAQREVEEVLQKHGLKPSDKLTYEAVQDMKFMDLCIMETTRKYPGLPVLNRICTQDYKVPDTDHTIEKGTPIIISLLGLHRDPAYFPNPMDYDPERFTDEKRNYDPTAYMPFGEGPRHCIAQRMGKVNTKVALAKFLSNFNMEVMERKELDFAFDPAIVLMPEGGLNVRLSKKIF